MCSNWALRSGWLAFARLVIGLQAEAQALQQAANQLLTRDEALLGQRRRQMALALADPQQDSLGITPDRRLHEVVQGLEKTRLRLGRLLAPAAPPANPRATQHHARPQVFQAATNGAARNPGHLRNRCDAAPTRGARFVGREQAAAFLVQPRFKRIEAGFDGGGIDHTRRVDSLASASLRFPDSFVAYLLRFRFFPFDSVFLAQALSPRARPSPASLA